jgi:eukaryotic-like serine/threonine-protein kinase
MGDVAEPRRLYEVFEAALEIAPARRAAFLDTACAGNAALRREVESLLDSLIEARTEHILPPLVDRLHTGEFAVGQRVADYEIDHEIGAGGMGVVYRAHRGPMVVALKVIRGGRLASADALRRFRQEHQVLARLVHPGITRLFDAGVTKHQVPYFAMELVDGQRIDTYCDLHRLDVHRRVALFADVCRTVAFAHEHQIVHRDLKPSNILVTPAGAVKLLDFGIAKLLSPDASGNAPPVTRASAIALTPQYASPEQLMGASVTARSDVYALGLVLYELLTGRRPHPTFRSPLVLIEHLTSRSIEPPSASALRFDGADELAADRSTTPLELAGMLAGSLDAIILGALSYEPARRPASAGELGASIDRWVAPR